MAAMLLVALEATTIAMNTGSRALAHVLVTGLAETVAPLYSPPSLHASSATPLVSLEFKSRASRAVTRVATALATALATVSKEALVGATVNLVASVVAVATAKRVASAVVAATVNMEAMVAVAIETMVLREEGPHHVQAIGHVQNAMRMYLRRRLSVTDVMHLVQWA